MDEREPAERDTPEQVAAFFLKWLHPDEPEYNRRVISMLSALLAVYSPEKPKSG